LIDNKYMIDGGDALNKLINNSKIKQSLIEWNYKQNSPKYYNKMWQMIYTNDI